MDIAQFIAGNITQLCYKVKPLLGFPGSAADIERLVGIMPYLKKTWKKDRPIRFGTLAYDSGTSRQAEDPRLIERAKEMGIEVLPFEYFPFTATDFGTYLQRLHSTKKADYVWLRASASQMGSILKDAMRLNLKDKMTFLASYISMDNRVAAIAGKEACAGIMAEIGFATPDEDVPGVNLLKRIRAKYRKGPLPSLYMHGAIPSMFGHEVTKRTLERVGLKKLGGRALAETAWTVKNFDTGGLVPPITMQKGNPTIARCVKMAKWQKDGKMVPVSDWMEVPWIVGR